MKYVQAFLVGSSYLGDAQRLPVPVHGELQPPASYAFFCPVCSDVWARAGVRHPMSGAFQNFMVWTRPCTRHTGDAYGISGSLLLPWDRSFNDSLPLAALQREVILHCDDWLKRKGIGV